MEVKKLVKKQDIEVVEVGRVKLFEMRLSNLKYPIKVDLVLKKEKEIGEYIELETFENGKLIKEVSDLIDNKLHDYIDVKYGIGVPNKYIIDNLDSDEIYRVAYKILLDEYGTCEDKILAYIFNDKLSFNKKVVE